MGKEAKKQTHLKPQDPETVDPSKLTALTPEVVSPSWVFCCSTGNDDALVEFKRGGVDA